MFDLFICIRLFNKPYRNHMKCSNTFVVTKLQLEAFSSRTHRDYMLDLLLRKNNSRNWDPKVSKQLIVRKTNASYISFRSIIYMSLHTVLHSLYLLTRSSSLFSKLYYLSPIVHAYIRGWVCTSAGLQNF